MKRLFVALGVLAIVIGISLTGLVINTNTANYVKERLEASIDYADSGNFDQAKEELRQAIDEWEVKMETMLIFVSHGKLDEIEEAINIADTYLNQGEISLYYAECTRASTLLDHFENVEYPNINNIF